MVKLAETFVGLFILAAIASLFFLAFKVSGVSSYHKSNSYQITAAFDNIGDLKPRAAVAMAGVKIGQVTAIKLNTQTYQAVVTMRIASNEAIPEDSSASIVTAGLLGANYIALTPGFSDTFFKNGDKIVDTHPALILEDMIGQLLFSMKKDDNKDADTADAATTNVSDATSSASNVAASVSEPAANTSDAAATNASDAVANPQDAAANAANAPANVNSAPAVTN